MTRRMIDADIFQCADLITLPPAARLLFIGLIVNADDEGLGRAEPAYLRNRILPGTRTSATVLQQWLDALVARDMLTLDVQGGASVYQITNFHRYQKLKYKRASTYKALEGKGSKEKGNKEEEVQGQYVAKTSTPATPEKYPLIDDIAMTFAIGYAKAGKIVESFGTTEATWELWKEYAEEKGVRLAVMNIQRYPTPDKIPGTGEAGAKPFAQVQEEKAKADARRLRGAE